MSIIRSWLDLERRWESDKAQRQFEARKETWKGIGVLIAVLWELFWFGSVMYFGFWRDEVDKAILFGVVYLMIRASGGSK